MKLPPPLAAKTDLIISMTLAEIFLLMLFVLWYSQGAGAGPEWEEIARARDQQIGQLMKKLDDQTQELNRLKELDDFWRKHYGVSPPATLDALIPPLRRQGLIPLDKEVPAGSKNGRSNLTPKCSELGLKEVLFNTSVRGRNLYAVNGKNTRFDDLLAAYDNPLTEARKKECKYSINVAYQPDLTAEDFVVAFNRLRSVFYVHIVAHF